MLEDAADVSEGPDTEVYQAVSYRFVYVHLRAEDEGIDPRLHDCPEDSVRALGTPLTLPEHEDMPQNPGAEMQERERETQHRQRRR